MNIATKQRVLAALRHTTAGISAIAADHAIDQQDVRELAAMYNITIKMRGARDTIPRLMASAVPALAASQFDILAANAAKIGSLALLRRQIETGQYSEAARNAWLERHGVAA